MLKLKVYDVKERVSVVQLKLFQEYDGIVVRVVNEDGTYGGSANILKITDEGTLRVYPGLDSKYGFQLADAGKIKVSLY